MSRVELSQNIGPRCIESISNAASGPVEGAPFETSRYTLHGYQLITDGIALNTNVAFKILGTNDELQNWQVIAQYDIKGETAPLGPRNADGVLYFDLWNFKYAKCLIEGNFVGLENFSVIEKHNA